MEEVERMMADIEREVEYTRHMIGRDYLSERVMDAMRTVPRATFVPDHMKRFAFDNGPLPIGTGSGYQAAVLSVLVKKVYSLEIIPELSAAAQKSLQTLHYDNVETRSGNGYQGWPEHAPYDGIIVTAAATHIPPVLIEQLKPGGHLVIPVAMPYFHQELMLVEKDAKDKTKTSNILGVAFVPMVDKREVSMGADGSAAEPT